MYFVFPLVGGLFQEALIVAHHHLGFQTAGRIQCYTYHDDARSTPMEMFMFATAPRMMGRMAITASISAPVRVPQSGIPDDDAPL